MIVQVDRVASVKEAVAFRDAGATLIGVALDPNPLLDDVRFVSPDAAREIRTAVAPARLVGLAPLLPGNEEAQNRDRLERLLALRPDFLQFHRDAVPDALVPTVLASGLPLIGDGWDVCADHGPFIDPADPASFVRDQFDRLDPLRPTLHHLDIVPDRERPWLFFRDEASDAPGEFLQAADVAATARELPLLVSLTGVTPEEVSPYTRAFPGAQGFFARLGADGEAPGPRTIAPGSLLALLRSLQTVLGQAAAPARR